EEGRVVFREMLGEIVWWEVKGNESMKGTEGRIRKVLGNIEKEGKEKKENERWERKVEGAKSERQVWEIVNRERKR
ncbi:hypothetical protein ALC57_15676, partial [Trachymyrmex cornetzi]